MDAVEIIKLMLAPAVMVNCCGLFLLTMNNKYSTVVGRIRALNEEKRKLMLVEKTGNIAEHESKRLSSIKLQTEKLTYRIKLVRNAVVSFTLAVAFFVLNCIAIGLKVLYNLSDAMSSISLILFFIGLISVFMGVWYATKEVIKGYEIVKIEVADLQ